MSARSLRRLAGRIIMNRLEEKLTTSYRRENKNLHLSDRDNHSWEELPLCSWVVLTLMRPAVLQRWGSISPRFFLWPTGCTASWRISVLSWLLLRTSSFSHKKKSRWSPGPGPGNEQFQELIQHTATGEKSNTASRHTYMIWSYPDVVAYLW